MLRRLSAVLGSAVFFVVLAVQAQPPAPDASTKPKSVEPAKDSKDNVVREQDRLLREWKQFEGILIRMAQRLDKSTNPEDKARAEGLRKAIDLANKEGVENRFQKLITTLVASKTLTVDDLQKAADQNVELIKILRDMLEMLLTDNEVLNRRAEIARLTEILKQVERIIRDEKVTQARIEGNKVDPKTIGKEQNKITQNTESVARSIGANKPNEKSDAKEGEAKGDKGDANKAEPKDDHKGPKGDNKDPKAGDPKKDPNDKKDPAGDSKGKPGDAKDAADSKGKPKDGADSAGEPKKGEQKPGDQKPGDPKKQDSKPAESKAKPDNKADAKGGDSKDGKPSDQQAKAGESKPSQGQQNQSQSKPNQNQQANQNQQNQNQNQNPQSEQAKKQIQDAIENQKKAEDELKKPDREKSAENVAKAIDDLEKLKKELEKRLKQLREEELERLLANLQSRCERMLAMQTEVYEGTKRVYGVVQTYPDKKATRAEEQRSQQLSTREGEIVKLANSTLQLLEAEGTAVAFAGVLESVRDDMINVEKRLDKYDVSPFTQRIEEDIIAQLKDMIEALKKAQQDIKDNKDKPPPPSNRPPPPQRLLDLLAELKLIRSMQFQVNKRTKDYGATYQGEQADEGQVQGEIQQLGKRQVKIEEMTKSIATGKNQ